MIPRGLWRGVSSGPENARQMGVFASSGPGVVALNGVGGVCTLFAPSADRCSRWRRALSRSTVGRSIPNDVPRGPALSLSPSEHGTRRPQPVGHASTSSSATAPDPTPREVRGDKDQRVLHAPSLTKTAASGAPLTAGHASSRGASPIASSSLMLTKTDQTTFKTSAPFTTSAAARTYIPPPLLVRRPIPPQSIAT